MGQFLKRLFSPLHIVSRAHLPEAASTLRAGLALGNVPERRARLPHASRPLPRLCTLGILGDRCSSRPSQLPSPGLALMSRLLAAADRPSSSPVTPEPELPPVRELWPVPPWLGNLHGESEARRQPTAGIGHWAAGGAGRAHLPGPLTCGVPGAASLRLQGVGPAR